MQTIARSSEQYTNTIQRRSGEACDRKQRRCPPIPHDARHYTRKECPALCFYGRATIRITYIVLYVATTTKSYRAAIVRGIGAPPARFAHDSNILRMNLTDGAGPMPYLPYTCVMEFPTSGVLVPSWRGGCRYPSHAMSQPQIAARKEHDPKQRPPIPPSYTDRYPRGNPCVPDYAAE